MGPDTKVTTRSIARQNFQPVNKSMIKLVNQNVKYVDSVALSAIASAIPHPGVIQHFHLVQRGTTAQNILTDVATAKASILALNQGYDPDTVVLDDLTWAYAYAKFTPGLPAPRDRRAEPSGHRHVPGHRCNALAVQPHLPPQATCW